MGNKLKIVNAEHVDFKNGILHECLQQIRCQKSEQSDPKSPYLLKVWCCDIEPRCTPKILTLIREQISPKDEILFNHIKRFRKVTEHTSNLSLRVVLCSSQFLKTKEEVIDFVVRHRDDVFEFDIVEMKIPKHSPDSKETSLIWSERYWPMSWKGDPNHQFLISAQFDIEYETTQMKSLLKEAILLNKPNTSSTYIGKLSGTNEFKLISSAHNTGSMNPYDHSVIKAVEGVAVWERAKRSNGDSDEIYLCQDMVVYTTHEPCVMCCMALVHSRIKRIIFLGSSSETGGLESNYNLGDRDGLNWKFEIWKWIGKNEVDLFRSKLEIVENHQY